MLSKLDNTQLKAFWYMYVIKAAHYENRFVRVLRGMFINQRREAISNLKKGKRDSLIDVIEAKESYVEKATPILTNEIINAVEDAQALVIPRKQVGLFDIPNEDAVKWLKTRMNWVANETSNRTANLLSTTLSEGFAEGESIPKLTNRVKSVFKNCSDVRAQRIARTETIQASAQGALIGYKDAGVERVEFYAEPGGCCDSCLALHKEVFPVEAAAGVITVHPNCRCVWIPIVKIETEQPPAQRPAKPKPPSSERPNIQKPVQQNGLSGQDWKKSLTQTEREALNGWGGGGYTDIREYQMTGKGSASIKKYTKALENALDKDSHYEGDLWRGLSNLDAKTYKTLENAKSFRWDALSSASKKEVYGADFAHGRQGKSVVFKIKSKTGVDFTPISVREEEVIMRAGSKYDVVGKNVRTFKNRAGGTFEALEIQLVEV